MKKLNERWSSLNKRLGVVSGGKFQTIREINDEEYEEYKNADFLLRQFAYDQQLFSIVRLNYKGYIDYLEYCIEEYNKYGIDYVIMERMLLNINRHLLNYLSSVRTFLDHSEYNLVKRYSKNSQRYRDFKIICSSKFDNCFSYRFLYKLRNYAQHCGMPVENITIVSEKGKPQTKEILTSVIVELSRNTLLSKYDSWGKLKKEIENLPEIFEANKLVAEMMECLEDINLKCIEADYPVLINNAQFIKNFIVSTKGKDGVPGIFNLEELNQEGGQLKVEWVPVHLVDIVIP